MFLRLVLLATGAIVVFAACDSATSFPDRDDEEYHLEDMALSDEDMPSGIAERQSQEFDNATWAEAFPNSVDEETTLTKKNQLDAQGRVNGLITFFSWETPIEHLGRPYQYTTHSTLFVDVESAQATIDKFCDLPIEETRPLTEFKTPRIGDQSVGFQVREELSDFGESVDTVICFRTGRVVHAVVQSGLDGTSDIALSVRLAKRMLKHVEAAFASRPPEEETPSGG